ncbi:M48 family metallopeptidase [Pseudomonas psychrotolerans]|uniref:M48 family metallopeptidase n=1 Tax=Pseudomonas TaxID=286 RepID=UPI00104F1E17|nr:MULTISPECIES: M48 family metallopeptidase [Pseudomonas]MBA1183019.1 M48 family metallopeptidase [Pseudomonas psychrotolerans]MBA1213592.1 M48 family metallopeptidase [Pseudomonas psychrotolerans]TCQ84172.1 Zn-dependent protease with chaperone function [Pseudomonas sp. JUb52]
MRFLDDQAAARRRTRLCLALLALVVLLMALASAGLALVFLPRDVIDYLGGRGATLVKTGLAFTGIIAGASFWKVRQLARQGGEAVVRRLGAVPLDDEADPRTRQLHNVVAEMALAAGVPVPRLYLLPDEPAINAFISGYGPADASLCLTRGALQLLNRDELQGVVAHEFSHLLNGDMRLNLRLLGWLHGISLIADLGQELFSDRTSTITRVDGNRLLGWLLGTVLLAVGGCGLFFANLIQAAAARSRERLADASAVQFTRQPQGLANALKKIAAHPLQGRLYHRRARSVAHMVLGDSGASWFATHPPVLERIQHLEPDFDEWQLERLRAEALLPMGVAYVAGSPSSSAVATAAAALPPASEAATTSLRELPPALQAFLRQPEQAAELLLALAGSASAAGSGAGQRWVDRLHPSLRLPLAQLTFPAIRQLPRPALRQVLIDLKAGFAAASELDLFRYCLAHIIQRQLIGSMAPGRQRPPGRGKLAQAQAAVLTLYAVTAEHSHADGQAARQAFLLAVANTFPGQHCAYLPPRPWRPALEDALVQLRQLRLEARLQVLEGLVCLIEADRTVRTAELELLRVCCTVLELPLPAIGEGVSLSEGKPVPGRQD